MKYLLLLILGLFLIVCVYAAIMPQDLSIIFSSDFGNLKRYIDMEARVARWYLYNGGIKCMFIIETNLKTLY